MGRQQKKPSICIPDQHFYVHSLTGLCNAVRRELVVDIVRYSESFHKLFMKHLTSETEVKIEDGVITAESDLKLDILEAEWQELQYRREMSKILEPWERKLGGQPIETGVAVEIR